MIIFGTPASCSRNSLLITKNSNTMKRQIIFLFTYFFLFLGNMWAQCPTGSQAFSFDTQSEVDAFAANYPNCTELPYLRIYQENGDEFDLIGNLSGFNHVTAITGGLSVEYLNIGSLVGLNNLTSIGGNLTIDNVGLVNVGLSSLTSIGGSFSVIADDSYSFLQSLSGLENLSSVGGSIGVSGEGSALPAVSTLAPLSNLTTVGGNLWFEFLPLTNLDGLENLTSIGGQLLVFGCNSMTDINALANLNSIGSIEIQYNNNLSECAVQAVCDHINANGSTIIQDNDTGCDSVAEVEAVCAGLTVGCPAGGITCTNQQVIDDFPTNYATCTTISGNVYIDGSGGNVTNLDGLSQIVNIEGNLTIENVGAITDLSAFENLTSIDGQLSILGCSSLTNIDALENLTSVGSINIQNNSSLSNCAIQTVCDHIAANGTTTIQNNNTGCNSAAQVTNICLGFANCPAGGVTFTTQQEVDDFQTNFPGCTTIPGNVYIDGIANSDINNFNGLNQLVNIEGNLIFQSVGGITDLSGLENLSTIGGDLYIDSNYNLTSLAGLENLNSIGGSLYLYYNNPLANLTSLSNLTTIGGSLYVEGNSVSSLAGLDNVTSIGGNLDLFFSYSLTDISNLQALTSVGPVCKDSIP